MAKAGLLSIGGSMCALFLLMTACTATADSADENEPAGAEDQTAAALSKARVNIKYEGTCDFLRSCSSYSQGLPEGRALWGCPSANEDVDGDTKLDHGACVDSELWVAGPTRGYCGQTVTICRRIPASDGNAAPTGNGASNYIDSCVDAVVKDISISRSWEASNGVLDALQLPYGLHGRCSGFGGGNVTVTTK